MEAAQAVDYCARYGFTQEKINARLALLQLTAADRVLAGQLQAEVIQPHVAGIIDAFYAQLLQHHEVTRILDKGFSLEHLKRTQTAYMLSLGRDFATPAYFNDRLRVGSTHQRVGVPLSLYQSSYALLQELLLRHVPASLLTPGDAGLPGFILRITALDMSLAIETYHQVEVDALAQSLATVQHEARALRQRVGRDELTHLANHRQILESLQQAVAVARLRRQPLCLIMADIDLFKQVNDQHGHLAGDEVLRTVASRIKAAVQRTDPVGRYGGEEFLVILPKGELPAGIAVAERIRRRVNETPIQARTLEVPVTISLGVACLAPGMDLYDLIEQADRAMYVAKAAGRNRVATAPDLAQALPV